MLIRLFIREAMSVQAIESFRHRTVPTSNSPSIMLLSLYTSDAADDLTRVALGGRRLLTTQTKTNKTCLYINTCDTVM